MRNNNQVSQRNNFSTGIDDLNDPQIWAYRQGKIDARLSAVSWSIFGTLVGVILYYYLFWRPGNIAHYKEEAEIAERERLMKLYQLEHDRLINVTLDNGVVVKVFASNLPITDQTVIDPVNMQARIFAPLLKVDP